VSRQTPLKGYLVRQAATAGTGVYKPSSSIPHLILHISSSTLHPPHLILLHTSSSSTPHPPPHLILLHTSSSSTPHPPPHLILLHTSSSTSHLGCCRSRFRVLPATSGVNQRRRLSMFVALLAVFCLSLYYNITVSAFIVKHSFFHKRCLCGTLPLLSSQNIYSSALASGLLSVLGLA
jgi:hypothetical protein